MYSGSESSRLPPAASKMYFRTALFIFAVFTASFFTAACPAVRVLRDISFSFNCFSSASASFLPFSDMRSSRTCISSLMLFTAISLLAAIPRKILIIAAGKRHAPRKRDRSSSLRLSFCFAAPMRSRDLRPPSRLPVTYIYWPMA